MTLGATPSQTVGPFLHIGLTWEDGPYVVASGTGGAIRVDGHVFDGHGDPVPDAMIETWQADPDGRFDHPDDPRGARAYEKFRGFGRCHTDAAGSWSICTLKPGRVPGDGDTPQAPHLDVSVFARGLLHRLVTRVYFADEDRANAADPVLASVDEARRHTLVARRTENGYALDIVLQGDDETVFFDL